MNKKVAFITCVQKQRFLSDFLKKIGKFAQECAQNGNIHKMVIFPGNAFHYKKILCFFLQKIKKSLEWGKLKKIWKCM